MGHVRRRVRAFGWSLAGLFLASALFAAGVVVAKQGDGADQQETAAAVVITAPVEAGPLVDTLRLDCRTAAERVSPAPELIGEGWATRPVLTDVLVQPGASVGEGDVIAEVTGLPIIVIAGMFPLYRDLSLGDRGPDVELVEEAIQRLGYIDTADDVLSAGSLRGLDRMFREAGYSLPVEISQAGTTMEPTSTVAPSADQHEPTPASEAPSAPSVVGRSPYLPYQQVLVFPALPVTAGLVRIRVGALAGGPPFDVVQGQTIVECPLGIAEARRLEESGSQALVEIDRLGLATVVEVLMAGPGRQDEDNTQTQDPPVAGDDSDLSDQPLVRLEPPGGPVLSTGEQYDATVTLRSASPGSVVVPSAAVWTQPGSRAVVTVVDGESQRDVGVVVEFEVDGRVAVLPDGGELGVEDAVLVSRQ